MAPKTRSQGTTTDAAPASSSSSPAVAAPPSLPSLPHEIILHIIRLALPPGAYHNFSVRSDLLRAFALVSPGWRNLARSEVLYHPVLKTKKSCKLLVQLLAGRKGKELGRHIRELSVEEDLSNLERPFAESYRLQELIGSMPCLEKLCLKRIEAIDLDQVSSGTALRQLYCEGVGFISPLAPSRRRATSTITRLSLRNCSVPPGTILASSLPDLKEVSLVADGLHDYQFTETFSGASMGRLLQTLAPQLEAISLDDRVTSFLHTYTPLLSNLSYLSIPLLFSSNTDTLLRSLPGLLDHLHLRTSLGQDFPPDVILDVDSAYRGLSTMLAWDEEGKEADICPSLRQLKSLRLPARATGQEFSSVFLTLHDIREACELHTPSINCNSSSDPSILLQRGGMEAEYEGGFWELVEER